MPNDSSSPASFTHLSVLWQTTYLAQSHSALRSFATSLIDSTVLDTFCLGIPTLPDFDAPFARCLVSRLRHFLGVFHSLTPKFCIFFEACFFCRSLLYCSHFFSHFRFCFCLHTFSLKFHSFPHTRLRSTCDKRRLNLEESSHLCSLAAAYRLVVGTPRA